MNNEDDGDNHLVNRSNIESNQKQIKEIMKRNISPIK
jgi:hypothetical protein